MPFADRRRESKLLRLRCRRLSEDEERRFSLSKGEEERIERTSDRQRSSTVRARSQAKVDKGLPSRTVKLWRVGRGKESRVGREEERSRRRYYRHLSEIDVPRHGTKAQRG